MNFPEAPDRLITLRDVARQVGLSNSAVSMALRNSPEIGLATREKIQAVAASMGYRPNPLAVGMAHFRRDSKVKPIAAALAWLNTWPKPEGMRRFREFDLYWQGASRSAENSGYRLEEFVVSEKMPLQRIQNILLARNIRGILIPPQQGTAVDWNEMQWENFSTVCISRRTEPLFAHFVTSAQAANAMLAFDRMRALGYLRVAFAGPLARQRMWGAGFGWAQYELPPDLRIPPFLIPEAELPNAGKRLQAWVKKHRPDAILTEYKILPELLKKIGIRIPEDIGLAATSVLDEPIDAGIYQSSEEIGRVSALTLISLINDYDRGIPKIYREILVKGKWIDGSSLPARHYEDAELASRSATMLR